jgi:hypothetical protein
MYAWICLPFQIYQTVYFLDIFVFFCFETEFKVRSVLILIIWPTKMCVGDIFMFFGAIYISLFAFHSGLSYVFLLLGIFVPTVFGCIFYCV